MNITQLVPAERAALVATWRQHRRAFLRLSIERDGMHNALEWLNSQLTFDDLMSDMRAYGFDQDELCQFVLSSLGERTSPHPSEPLTPEHR